MLSVVLAPATTGAELVDENTITGSNDAVGRSTVQPAWIIFWCVGVSNDKLELNDGAAGGRDTKKNGDQNEEEDEFELESGDSSRKCGTPVSFLCFVGEEDLARQKVNVLRAFKLNCFCALGVASLARVIISYLMNLPVFTL